MKREKTKYQGVYFYLKKCLNSDVLEKAYYIMYRQGGRGSKLVEEPVGRESEGMTAARAAHIRADRARGLEKSNTERRAAEEAARLAEASRPALPACGLYIAKAYRSVNAGKRTKAVTGSILNLHSAKKFLMNW